MLLDILGNLIAAAIGAFVAFFWVSLAYPAIIEGFFEPTKLAREYRGVLDFGRGPHHTISLQVKKRGYRVRGKLVFLQGRHKGKEYPVKGRYAHSLLTFHYYPSDKMSTSQGTATFQRLRDGELFLGYFAY
ncbi:MAG TPA: hypothetical protein VMW27_17950, partial [Thermoanaerobaculia bacterium]|nr:hypothetical protein [Thermoanaerobaculia bacterium]